MAFTPIATGIQYEKSTGAPYSGAVLKAYRADGTTPIQMATDSTGLTLVNTITLNTLGMPTVSGNFVFPHIDQTYRIALYPNQASADSNTGSIWITSSLTPAGVLPNLVDSLNNFNELRNYTGLQGVVTIKGGSSAGDGLGGTFFKVTGAAPGTYVDNGHTVILPTGGNGSTAWIVIPERNTHIAAGTGAAYTVATLTPTLVSGRTYRIKLNVPNTGACTLTPSSGSAINIKTRIGTNPIAGQLLASNYLFEYDGTNLIALTDGDLTFTHVSAGTGAAYTVSTLPPTLTTNNVYRILIHTANTGNCTLAPGGGSAINIKLLSGADPVANQLLNKVYDFWYNGTNLIPLNPEGYSSVVAKFKPSDTSIANLTTLTDDPHLLGFNLQPGDYIVEAALFVSSANITPGFKSSFQLVSGSQTNNVRRTRVSHNGGIYEVINTEMFTSATHLIAATPNISLAEVTGNINIISTSTIDFQWAQDVSSAAATTIHAGSYIRFTRI